MASKILQKVKEKRKGVIVVHNNVAVYSDLVDKNNLTYDSLTAVDFDNYLLSFGFVKNVVVTVDVLTPGTTAVVIVGDDAGKSSEFEHLSYLFKIFHLKNFDDFYLSGLVGINLAMAESQPVIKKLTDGNEISLSVNSEYKKILKDYPHFNPNKIRISGTVLLTVILFASVMFLSFPNIHAEVIETIGHRLIDAGYNNRAFQLCDVANILMPEKKRECKIEFIPYLLNPSQSLDSFEKTDYAVLVDELIMRGNDIREYKIDMDQSIARIYYETAQELSENKSDFGPDKRSDIFQETENGIGNVWMSIDPHEAIIVFDGVLSDHPENIPAQIGKAHATQNLADLKRDYEPEIARDYYNRALVEYVDTMNNLIDISPNSHNSGEIDCYLDFDEDYLRNDVGYLNKTDGDDKSKINALRGIANTCYGLMTLDDDFQYEKIRDYSPIRILEKILNDYESENEKQYSANEVKTSLSKAKILSDMVKYYHENNVQDSDLQKNALLNEAVSLYETVLDSEPGNKTVLKDLFLLYFLQGNDENKKILERLKNNNDKTDALVQGSLFFIESGRCDDAKVFYDQSLKILDNDSFLKDLKQKIAISCA